MNKQQLSKKNTRQQNRRRGQRRQGGASRKTRRIPRRRNPPGNPPVAFRSTNTIIGATIKNVDAQTVRIKHREFVKPIKGSGGDWVIVETLPLNPGLPDVFTWLNATARNYESYRVENFVVEYVPTVPTSTPGSVSIFIDYDAADSAPESESAFKNAQGATTVPTWQKMNLISMKEQLNKAYYSRYTRVDNLPQNLDIKTYDFGKLYIAVEGVANTNKIGDLYVRYDIILLTPQLGKRHVIPGDNLQHIHSFSTQSQNPFSGATSVGATLATVESDGVVVEEDGNYLMEYVTAGTGLNNFEFTPPLGGANRLLVGLLGAGSNKMVNNVLYALTAGTKVRSLVNGGPLTGTDLYISKISQGQYEALMDDVAGLYPVQ